MTRSRSNVPFTGAALVACLVILLVAGDAVAKEVRISITGLKFKPAAVEVNVGDIVTWVNDDESDHTVAAKNEEFNSGNIPAGKSFSHKFKKAGEFPYGCDYHPRMKGKVVVKKQ